MELYRRKEGLPMATLMYASYLVLTGKSVAITSTEGTKQISVSEAKKILNIS